MLVCVTPKGQQIPWLGCEWICRSHLIRGRELIRRVKRLCEGVKAQHSTEVVKGVQKGVGERISAVPQLLVTTL